VTQFKAALSGSVPGDVIVLDAGVVYSGNFTLPKKVNPSNKWIYITSSAYASLPGPGIRVSPADATHMPRIVSPGYTKPINVAWGANYWRVVGIEFGATSNYPPGCGVPGQRKCNTGQMFGVDWAATYELPHHVYIDRCYLHGEDNQDVVIAAQMNWNYAALIDSYVSNIHAQAQDSVAAGAFNSLGPFKITNNYLEAAGENILFGGSGKNFNVGVPSDIEIRGNYIYKPLSWIAISKLPSTDPTSIVVKNSMECKSCLRLLFDSNVVENMWAAGQIGYALVLTVRSAQSGDFSVVTDITVTNNTWKNILAFTSTLAADDACLVSGGCNNAGSIDRWNISNNLVTLLDPSSPGWGGSVAGAISMNPGIDNINHRPGRFQNVVFQHNSVIGVCTFGMYFNTGGAPSPPPEGLTQNVWLLDNVPCKQTTGSWGTGGTHTADYMGVPNTPPYDLPARYYGNVMLKGSDAVATWPPHNLVATSLTFDSNNILVTPDYRANTTDGLQAGVIGNVLIINTTSLPDGLVGVPYNNPLTATGGVLPYTWSIASGSMSVCPTLTNGLCLTASTGTISGTPIGVATMNFTVRVTDGAATQQTAPLSIVVRASAPTLVVTSLIFPNAILGTSYNQFLTATGGVPPYTWDLASGALPPGISIVGNQLLGTPTTLGVSTFTLRVTDSNVPPTSANGASPSIITVVDFTQSHGVNFKGRIAHKGRVAIKK
jgi:hypothetical protein